MVNHHLELFWLASCRQDLIAQQVRKVIFDQAALFPEDDSFHKVRNEKTFALAVLLNNSINVKFDCFELLVEQQCFLALMKFVFNVVADVGGVGRHGCSGGDL